MRAVIWAGYGWEVDEVFEVRGGVEEPVENKILRGKIKENNVCDHKNDYPNPKIKYLIIITKVIINTVALG